MIEFAYNNIKHAFTKMLFFEIMFEYSPKITWKVFINERIKSKSVKQHIKKLDQLIIVFKERLHNSQKHQTKYKIARIKVIKF